MKCGRGGGSGCEVGGGLARLGRVVWGWAACHSGVTGLQAKLDKLMVTADEANRTGGA